MNLRDSLAELMYLGKLVIATNWLGNVDYMNENNSNQQWAEPEMDHAAYLMKQMVDDIDHAHRIGFIG